MKNFSFHQGSEPDGFQYNFTPSLFNQTKHLKLQSNDSLISFFLLDNEKKKVEGLFHVFIANDKAVSPLKAPYGSFEFSWGVVPKLKFEFIEFCISELGKLSVKEITIKGQPQLYDTPNQSFLSTCLLNLGFEIENAEVGTCIVVNESKFENIIKASERQALIKLRNSNFRIQLIDNVRVGEIYDFLKEHLTKKGYQLSMNREALVETVQSFPANFFLFGCYLNQELVAASVALKVNANVLYNFYIGHNEVYNSQSPAIMIIEALYEHCQKSGLSMLDLGTSALQGRPNFSLLDFKIRLGAIMTEKFTFHKQL